MPKPILRIIGDVHADFDRYRKLALEAEYSLQVGDFCCSKSFEPLDGLDPERHKIIPGNHDIYDEDHPCCVWDDPHFLCGAGLWEIPGLPSVFWIRGAFSIDGPRLCEEMSEHRLGQAVDHYERVKPKIVVSHQCPGFLSGIVGDRRMLRSFGFSGEPTTRTGSAMNRMFDIHEPEQWIFGHYHKRFSGYVGETRFECLDMLDDHKSDDQVSIDLPLHSGNRSVE